MLQEARVAARGQCKTLSVQLSQAGFQGSSKIHFVSSQGLKALRFEKKQNSEHQCDTRPFCLTLVLS